jgi:hypothetical protein
VSRKIFANENSGTAFLKIIDAVIVQIHIGNAHLELTPWRLRREFDGTKIDESGLIMAGIGPRRPHLRIFPAVVLNLRWPDEHHRVHHLAPKSGASC